MLTDRQTEVKHNLLGRGSYEVVAWMLDTNWSSSLNHSIVHYIALLEACALTSALLFTQLIVHILARNAIW